MGKKLWTGILPETIFSGLDDVWKTCWRSWTNSNLFALRIKYEIRKTKFYNTIFGFNGT
jgi:hypothetical protein